MTDAVTISRETLQAAIDALVTQHGSLRAVARVTEIDVGYLSRLRAGEKVNPEKAKLRRLGLRRVVHYEVIDPAPPAQPADSNSPEFEGISATPTTQQE